MSKDKSGVLEQMVERLPNQIMPILGDTKFRDLFIVPAAIKGMGGNFIHGWAVIYTDKWQPYYAGLNALLPKMSSFGRTLGEAVKIMLDLLEKNEKQRIK
jgi:hypothetical protein